MSYLGERARRLADVMADRGDWPDRSPWLRGAVEILPRDRFAPERLYRWDGHTYHAIDRENDPDGWAAEVYSGPDTAAVTQVTGGLPTSSLSCQAVVVDMLDSLLLEPGQRVLELGTGTGWSAALTARRAAPGRVVSVEVDTSLAETARRRLKAVGANVDVRVGDGADGRPQGAPYDRVISTYAVDTVPWAWVEQCAPGGRIVFPWGRLGHVALTVAPDGRSASGWVQGLAQFMPDRIAPCAGGPSATARDTDTGHGGYAAVRGTGPADEERPVHRDLTSLRDNPHLIFALRVACPDLLITTGAGEHGVNAWIHDGRDSWTALTAEPDGTTTAHQGGPRRLADELEHVWDHWHELGEPSLWDYGLTVLPDRQYAWCLDPATGPRRPILGDQPARLPLVG